MDAADNVRTLALTGTAVTGKTPRRPPLALKFAPRRKPERQARGEALPCVKPNCLLICYPARGGRGAGIKSG